MLSELSKTAARTIAARHELEALIFPAPAEPADLEPKSSLKVANKILAHLDGDLGATPQAVVDAVRAHLDQLAAEAFDVAVTRGGGAHLRRTEAEAQVRDLPEIYWVACAYADPGDYCRTRSYLEALMAARKNTRTFIQPTAWAAMSPKSSLDGLRESVIAEHLYDQAKRNGDAGDLPADLLYRYFRARRAERLSGVDLLKRLGNPAPAATFPSTSHVAALPAIARMERRGQENSRLREYASTYTITLHNYLRAETVEPLSGRFATPMLNGHDGSILYEARLREDDRLTDEAFAAVQLARRQFLKDTLGAGVEPSPYYMLLQGDGDWMGRAIDALETPAQHQAFSRQLSRFSTLVEQVVDRFGGALVYAGGDDVLAFLPLDTGLVCASTIADIFRTLLADFADQEKEVKAPTFSAGLVIAHHLEALSQTLQLARAAEHAAKHVPEKDALAITLSKRSGADRTIAGHWRTLTPQIEQMIELVHADSVPAGAAFDLRSLAVRLDGAVEDAARQEQRAKRDHLLKLQASEVARILKRKRGERGAAPLADSPLVAELLAQLGEVQPGAVHQFADALVIADLLADAQMLSGRTPAVQAALRTAALALLAPTPGAAQSQGGNHAQ
jgi:CRISPR-associated protein Cmr2